MKNWYIVQSHSSFENKVAGLIGENASEIGEYWTFTGIAIFCTLFGLLFLFLVKPLKRLIHDAE